MTLDEAIRHCLEQARKLQDKADRVGDDESRQCMECAADHIQLAEWLTELKERREADVQPVIHAAWIETTPNDYYEWYKCSNCKYTDTKKFNYFPKCGAKMDC